MSHRSFGLAARHLCAVVGLGFVGVSCSSAAESAAEESPQAAEVASQQAEPAPEESSPAVDEPLLVLQTEDPGIMFVGVGALQDLGLEKPDGEATPRLSVSCDLEVTTEPPVEGVFLEVRLRVSDFLEAIPEQWRAVREQGPRFLVGQMVREGVPEDIAVEQAEALVDLPTQIESLSLRLADEPLIHEPLDLELTIQARPNTPLARWMRLLTPSRRGVPLLPNDDLIVQLDVDFDSVKMRPFLDMIGGLGTVMMPMLGVDADELESFHRQLDGSMRLVFSLERGVLAAFGASDGEGLKEWFATTESELVAPTETPAGLEPGLAAYRSPLIAVVLESVLGVVRVGEEVGAETQMIVVPTTDALFASTQSDVARNLVPALTAWAESGVPRAPGASLLSLTADVHRLVDAGFLDVPDSKRAQTPERFEMNVEREQLTLRIRARTFTPREGR